MKQLLILSGKGGTGKTTVAAAFIKLAKARAYADCDVDAPNLHLTTNQSSLPIKKDYYGLPKASIDYNKCINCGKCKESCRYDAISFDGKYEIDLFACEGCGVCHYVCSCNAIALIDTVIGENLLYINGEVFSTATLKMGSGNSGKLVSQVKKLLKENSNAEMAIIDGSPGIGCPVIASLSGADMVLIVAEPSVSGISDMERIIKTAEAFNPIIAVCINKYDTNIELSNKIKAYCAQKNLAVLGEIPFDNNAVKAINENKTIIDIDCPSGDAVKFIFDQATKYLNGSQL